MKECQFCGNKKERENNRIIIIDNLGRIRTEEEHTINCFHCGNLKFGYVRPLNKIQSSL